MIVVEPDHALGILCVGCTVVPRRKRQESLASSGMGDERDEKMEFKKEETKLF